KKDFSSKAVEQYSSFRAGKISELLSMIVSQIEDEYLNHDMYIISDAQKSNFEKGTFDWNQISKWNTYFYKLPELRDNLAITDVKILNEIPVTNSPVDISVTIKNTGLEPAVNRLLQLSFDDINVGQQIISLESQSTNTFTFQTAFHISGLKEGVVELDSDSREEDNRFYFHVKLPDKMNITLISPKYDGVLFIRNAILALNQNETLFVVNQGNEQDLQFNLDLRNTDVLAIQGVPDIPINVLEQLRDFIESGGHLILSPGDETKNLNFINSLGLDEFRSSVIEMGGDSFQSIDFSSTNSKTFDIIPNSDRGIIKTFKIIPLPSNNKSLMFVNDKSSIWNRYQLGNGLVDIFGISMDLGWTNFPITGSFIPFWHKLLYSTTINQSAGDIDTESEWITSQVFQQNLQSLQHLLPDGTSEIVQPGYDGKLIISNLNIPGFHRIYNGENILNEIAVKIPESELISPVLEDERLKEKFPSNFLIIHKLDDLTDDIKLAQFGIELWKWFLGIFVLLMILEMLLANVYGSRKHQ
ncbi:MAG: hypothetical protein ACE5D7_04125, partial [Fidelibacterota bacterium]